MKKHLLLFLLLPQYRRPSYAQPPDKAELERERQEIQNELKQIQDMYNKVKGKPNNLLRQLNMLKKKITCRKDTSIASTAS